MINRNIISSINWDRENTIFYIAVLLTTILVYFSPNVLITRVVFLILLVFAYKSKRNYLWLAWFFIINDGPGNLFRGGGSLRDLVTRIPIYPVYSSISVGFIELFYLMLILKALSLKNNNYKFLFRKEFNWFWSFFVFLVILTIIQEGIYLDVFVTIFRRVLPWSLLFSVPKLLFSEKNFYNLCKILFPVVIIALLAQFFVYGTGNSFHEALVGKDTSTKSLFDDYELVRFGSAGMIIFFILIASLYYKIKGSKEFSSRYLDVIIFTASLSIFLTATRGWILAIGVVFLLLILTVPASILVYRIASVFISGTILYVILIFTTPFLDAQFQMAFARFETVGSIFQGDLSAGGTSQRIDVRGTRVWSQAKESLLLGHGFTATFFEYEDGHVAHHNIILNSGILGTIVLNLIYFSLIYRIWKLGTNRNIFITQRHSVKIFSIGLIGIYVIHSTSGQMWGYGIMQSAYFIYAFWLSFVNAIYIQSNPPAQVKTKMPQKTITAMGGINHNRFPKYT